MLKAGSVLLLLMAGCAHEQAATGATTANVQDEFTRAYEAVASGAKRTARGGGYLVERAGDTGGVRVVRAP